MRSWVDLFAGYISRWFTSLKTVTNPSNNRAHSAYSNFVGACDELRYRYAKPPTTEARTPVSTKSRSGGFDTVLCQWYVHSSKGAALQTSLAVGVGRSDSVVRRMNEFTWTLRSAWLVYWDGWLSSTRYTPRYITKPTRSTQPCIPLGSLSRVLALIG